MAVYRLLVLSALLFVSQYVTAQTIYQVDKGSITFNSNAPNEIIKATSEKLEGVIDVQKRTFAFKVDIRSFMGFNSPLQKDHFNENYMESHLYKLATFSGKIIEDIDLNEPGIHKLRAKGRLNIHGVEEERIIYAQVKQTEKKIIIASEFEVELSDHNIKIPRVVNDKLATAVIVSINARLIAR